MYDVAIIGGGVIGAAVAYELSKYSLSVCVIEKENDIAMGTTKANSGIIHAGYDPEPGTLMARLNVRGSELTEQFCAQSSVPYDKCGSVVVAFDTQDLEHIKKLYARGLENGVKGLRLISKEELNALEPNISSSAVGALFAETGAVVNPWRFCIALAETAAANGCEFLLDSEVTAIEKTGDSFTVTAGGRALEARYVINAAGIYADKISKMANADEFEIYPSKGQYYLLDKTQRGLVNTVVFQCPTEKGKGILVSPTADGNIIIGPNAESGNDRGDVSTTREGLSFVSAEAEKSVAGINYRDNIRSFSGLRANSSEKDFIIRESDNQKGFINAAGIKSPGLSSALAIGEYVVELLGGAGLVLGEKSDIKKPEFKKPFAEMDSDERAEACRVDPRYGNVICRCNTVTEAEIAYALENSCIKPRTVDGVKRRVGSGMGRCQGGFCGPKVHEIICNYYGVEANEVCLDKNGSYIVIGKVGEQE